MDRSPSLIPAGIGEPGGTRQPGLIAPSRLRHLFAVLSDNDESLESPNRDVHCDDPECVGADRRCAQIAVIPEGVATSAMRGQFAYFHPSVPRQQPDCSDSVGPGSMALLVGA